MHLLRPTASKKLLVQLQRRLESSQQPIKSSFDVDLVNRDYEERTSRAVTSMNNAEGNAFRIVLPPPNVTGRLHLGHALTVTVEDALCRWKRLRGQKAVWYPGFDHAGIATQSVVERQLWREKGVLRKNMGREEFVEECHKWSNRNSSVIRSQLTRMGASLDWDKEYYTLDKKFSGAVTRAFCDLHSDGLIYRDTRLVHWCPHLNSAMSDQEVDKVELTDAVATLSVPSANGGRRDVPVGWMHTVRYPVQGKTGEFLDVGTTRPETVFADVALAVHPDDERYSSSVGSRVQHPLLPSRTLPIIADSAVKQEKGTGVLKITPCHDALDAAIASRHRQEIEAVDRDAFHRQCIDEHGRMHGSLPPGYATLDRFDARAKVVSHLSSLGLYGGSSRYEGGQLSVCSRTGDIIEPRLAAQWFMHTCEMHEKAEKAVRNGEIVIAPASQTQRLLDWLAYTEPWCLSRQLDWGHRIPAWRKHGDNDGWVVAESERAARVSLGEGGIEQETDVLDTWFSSSLVPLVTAGWMEGRFDPRRPPIDVMETGHDILGFWVARMIIMTQRLSGVVPFSRVLLHGLVRDGSGRKMSKSLGNVVDPLDVLDGISLEKMLAQLEASPLPDKEKVTARKDMSARFPKGIPRSGADALRFALLRHDVCAADVPIDIAALADEGLKFCNKLWNLAAYVEQVREKRGAGSKEEKGERHRADAWLLSRVHRCIQQVDEYMGGDSPQPHLAFQAIHRTFLANLCDVYLETTKKALWSGNDARIGQVAATLDEAVPTLLAQLSVFMPFVSEHLFERLQTGENMYDRVVKADPSLVDGDLEERMQHVLAVTAAVRAAKIQLAMPTRMEFEGTLHMSGPSLDDLADVLDSLCGLKITGVRGADEEVEAGSVPVAVPGRAGKLAMRVEESHRADFIARLRTQMERSRERQRQFGEKAESYEKMVERDGKNGKVKASVVAKNAKKAEQARGVAANAGREAERLEKMIRQADTE